MSQFDLDEFRNKVRLLAASILESQQFPCALIFLFGERDGKTLSGGYTLTMRLKERFQERLPELGLEMVDRVKGEFHRDNGIWPAVGVVVLLLEDTPVAEIVDVVVEQFRECADRIHPDAKRCVSRVAVFGDPDEHQGLGCSADIPEPEAEKGGSDEFQVPERLDAVSEPKAENRIDRFVRIKGEERKVTLKRIVESDLSDQDKKDVMGVLVAIGDAVNAWVRKEDRFVSPQVLETALSEFLDEFGRIKRRGEAEKNG
jgi:hypothetical protein